MEAALSFADYQKALADGKLLGLRCKGCGECMVPPQAACSECGSRDLTVEEVEKSGTVQTFTVIRVAAEGMEAPFVTAMVELECGAWAMGNVDMDPDSANMDLIGKKVGVSSREVPGDKYALGDIQTLVFNLA
ncbi:MAG: Zn-ribbon domain-containing OB-fold protein [Desulfatibacillaceae bacterium]